jgi:hypothetical protein
MMVKVMTRPKVKIKCSDLEKKKEKNKTYRDQGKGIA